MCRRQIALALAATALLLAACEDAEAPATVAPTPTPTPVLDATPTPADTPTATPTPAPTPASEPIALDEDGLPEGAVGPILVYAARADRTDPHGELEYYRVFLYDAGAGEHIGRFEVAQQPLLAGREILVAYEQEVDAYRLDGTRDRTVVEAEDEDERRGPLLVSPDGQLLALSRHDGDVLPPSAVEIVEIGTGRKVVRVEGAALQDPEPDGLWWPAGWTGWPMPSSWSADGMRLLLRGLWESEAPGTLGFLTLSGELHTLGLLPGGLLDPTGTLLAYHEGGHGYEGPPPDNLQVSDVLSGDLLMRVSDDALGFGPFAWSPDGRIMLYEVFEPESESTDGPWTVRERRLYDVTTGEDIEAPPLLDLHAEWYGERAIVLECAETGEARPAWFHAGTPVRRCFNSAATILLSGDRIDEVNDPRILGWLEVDE